MMEMKEKIKHLRDRSGLSQGVLADKMGISVKTIQRYEKGDFFPESYILCKMSVFFDVPADYLLGTCSYEESQAIEEKIKSSWYKNYLNARNNYYICDDAAYYWIESERDMIGGQTEFVGWADEEHKKEIRRLREVIPRNAIKACELVKGKPMVLNDITDVTAFLCFGGQAIVKKEICEKYLPWFLDDFIVECNTLF